MSNYLLPDDQAFYDDKQLMADLADLNKQLSRYVLHMLDADAKRAEPVSVADELRFAGKLGSMADRLAQRAARRAAPNVPPVLEGETTSQYLTNDRPAECA
jgi:hypothetical protein